MVKFKIFNSYGYLSADEWVNEWLDDHPSVEVLDFKYQRLVDASNVGETSICIMYKELP